MGSALSRPGILYLHGFCSSPASWKSRLLAEVLAGRGLSAHFACPQLSPVPDEAIAQAEAIIESAAGPLTLVGSSLGGHYANYLAARYDLPAVVINPAVIDRLDLSHFVGEHANFHSGARFCFTEQHAAQLKAQVCKPSSRRTWVWLETGDEVLDWQLARDFYAECRQLVLPGGDHSFTKFPEFIPQLLEFAGI